MPPAGQLEFFGDDAAAALYAQAVERMEALGGRKVEIDFCDLPRGRGPALRGAVGGRALRRDPRSLSKRMRTR